MAKKKSTAKKSVPKVEDLVEVKFNIAEEDKAPATPPGPKKPSKEESVTEDPVSVQHVFLKTPDGSVIAHSPSEVVSYKTFTGRASKLKSLLASGAIK